jgi:hypothetical protein
MGTTVGKRIMTRTGNSKLRTIMGVTLTSPMLINSTVLAPLSQREIQMEVR